MTIKIPKEFSCKDETCIQKTPIALINQTMQNIEKQLEKIAFFIDSSNNKFSTKEEYKENKNAIDLIKKELKDIQIQNAKWIGGGVVLSTILGFIFNKFL